VAENSQPSLLMEAPRSNPAKQKRPEMAPQRLEKIESAPGNGMGSEASNPQDLVHRREAAAVKPRAIDERAVGGASRAVRREAHCAPLRRIVSMTAIPIRRPFACGWLGADTVAGESVARREGGKLS
jgi:hypothetical protein